MRNESDYECDELSAEEDAAVRLGLDDLAAGRVVPFDDVLREIRGRAGPA